MKSLVVTSSIIVLQCLAGCFAQSSCEDKIDVCDGWARSGECERNPDYMLENCQRSCKRCEVTAAPTERPTTTGFCENKNEYCDAWARSGQCERHPDYMLENCQRSCKRCKGPAGPAAPTQRPTTTDGRWTEGPNGKYYHKLNIPNKNMYDGRRLKKNKAEGRSLCEDVDGYLPKPMNPEESKFLTTFSNFFYLGMYYSSSEGVWRWDDDGTTVTGLDKVNWARVPNRSVGREICMDFTGGFNARYCHEKILHLVCERKHSDWTNGPTRGKQYIKLPYSSISKEKSREICKEAGGILPQPMDRAENDFLKSLGVSIWLGIYNDKEQLTLWRYDNNITNSGFIENYMAFDWGTDQRGRNQPLDYYRRENCVRTYRLTGWIKSVCNKGTSSVVCERQDHVWYWDAKALLRIV